jgi:nucleotide-binding universal stress UspA family protein
MRGTGGAVTIKTILVHVDTSPTSSARLAFAVELSKRFGAALIGIFILPSRELLELTTSGVALALAYNSAELECEVAAREREFREFLSDQHLDGEWRAARGLAAPCIARRARAADLVIIGQRDPEHPAILDAPEDVLLTCGRPVLVVPYTGRFDHIGSFDHIGGHALVAWNGSREATLALHDALPLLAASRSVTVMTVSAGDDPDAEAKDDLIAHVVRHGINARAERVSQGDLTPADATLSRVAELGADLVVMGAYGHSRLRETILGGMTRDMLQRMTTPVLMAH